MFIFRGNSRTFRCSAVLLKGSKTGFVCEFSYFSAHQLLRCSFFVVILVLFGVLNALERGFYNQSRAFLTFLALQHPAQELMFIFRGNFRTFRCSATSGPRTDVHFSC